ncbi:hypothetical protein LguiA_027232 [Lonicera macranthoides]
MSDGRATIVRANWEKVRADLGDEREKVRDERVEDERQVGETLLYSLCRALTRRLTQPQATGDSATHSVSAEHRLGDHLSDFPSRQLTQPQATGDSLSNSKRKYE